LFLCLDAEVSRKKNSQTEAKEASHGEDLSVVDSGFTLPSAALELISTTRGLPQVLGKKRAAAMNRPDTV